MRPRPGPFPVPYLVPLACPILPGLGFCISILMGYNRFLDCALLGTFTTNVGFVLSRSIGKALELFIFGSVAGATPSHEWGPCGAGDGTQALSCVQPFELSSPSWVNSTLIWWLTHYFQDIYLVSNIIYNQNMYLKNTLKKQIQRFCFLLYWFIFFIKFNLFISKISH